MFARNVSIRLKANSLNEFKATLEKEIVPMLRKQAGFRDEIALAGDKGDFVTAISLWDTKEQAEAYDKTGYVEVLKVCDKFFDGAPKVRLSEVINSTTHKLTAVAVVAAA